MIPDIGQKVMFHKELLDAVKYGSRKLAHEYLFLKYLIEEPVSIIQDVVMRFIGSEKQYQVIFYPQGKPSKKHVLYLDEEGRFKSSSTFMHTRPFVFREYEEVFVPVATYQVPGEVL